MLNTTSYHGAGAIDEIATEAKAHAFKKAFVCSDPDLIKFNVTSKVTDILDKNDLAYEIYSEKIKKRIRGLFDLMLSDNKKARTEDYHGKYSMIKCEGQPCNSQEMLYQEAYDRAAIKTENKVVE